jgi:hemolysin activation/secretion protein
MTGVGELHLLRRTRGDPDRTYRRAVGIGRHTLWLPRRRGAAGLSLVAFQLCWAGVAVAQQSPTPFPGQPEPGRNIPAPAAPPVPQFEFSIPAPQRGPIPRAVDEITFDVSDIKVVGSTLFKPEDFQPLTAPLIGKSDKLSDIISVADRIEAMYREKGYVLTRAFVPPQTVANGVFQINVVEGYVKAAAVNGGNDMTRDYVNAYVQPVTQEKPATIETMERALLMANSLPGVTASGLLRPSPTEPGASDLLVNLNEQPFDATVYSDNRGSALTGPITVGYQLVGNDLVYVPGQLMVDISGTPLLEQRRLIQAHYTRPVGYDGLTLTVGGVLAHGVPAALGGALTSDSYAASVHLNYPLIVSRALNVSTAGGLTVQGSKVTQGGTAGTALTAAGISDITNDDHWREADVSVSAQDRGLINDSVSSGTVGITQGIPVFGASSTTNGLATNTNGPIGAEDGSSVAFTKYTFTGQHDQPIVGPVSASFHALLQYSDERLMIGEQTSFGGSGIGRGYDPAALAGDSGGGLSSELRYDAHFPKYHLDTTQFYAFFDTARIWPNHDQAPIVIPMFPTNRNDLASIGFGVRVSLLQRATGGIEFAQQLKGVPNSNNGKTGARILFNAAIRY